MGTDAPPPGPGVLVPTTRLFFVILSQPAGTYTMATASNGLLIQDVSIFVNTTATGLTSISMQTDHTTPDVILSAVEGLVVNLTGLKNLKNYPTNFLLAANQHINYTIAGTGTAGSLSVVVRYVPLAVTATLA